MKYCFIIIYRLSIYKINISNQAEKGDLKEKAFNNKSLIISSFEYFPN